MKRLTLLLATFCIVQTSFSAPPNILFILVDDMGYCDPRCFNPESKIATPHIDRLAAEGMRFTDAHSGGSICMPSRYTLLSGRMPYRNWNAASAKRTKKGDWKLILPTGVYVAQDGPLTPDHFVETTGKGPNSKFQLYNLRTDPSEVTNLFSQEPGKAEELFTALKADLARGRSR